MPITPTATRGCTRAYTVPPEPKAFPPEQLQQLQPLFATILGRQAKDFVDQVCVEQY